MLLNHFLPASTYQFPLVEHGKQSRSFQHSWLSRYPGLVYSEIDKGGYCKYCILFGQFVHNLDRTLVNRPFTNFKKASDKLREHFGSGSFKKYHLIAVEQAEAFKQVMEHKLIPVDQQLSKARYTNTTIKKNRLKLKSIAETVIFCGRQGIGLRGHRDDWKHLNETPHSNPGNFVALLRFRVDSGDHVLADHLTSAGANALYTSKTVQNELIDVCGEIIRSTILDRIRAAGVFSIMADEATDAANKEQLAICIRYVDRNTMKIEERFMCFSECETGVTGQAIADRLLGHLVTWQLPASQLRGQTYDGAGAMAGKRKGAASRITEHHPKATYTHCAAHALNLCVVKCCSISEIRNTIDAADSVYRFFAFSPKRQLCLEKWVEQVLEGERRKKIKSVCKTRWVERHQAFEVFLDLYHPLVCCLEEMKNSTLSEWSNDTRKDAQSFFFALTRFPFLISLVVTKEVLGYTKALSIKLQGRYVDVVQAFRDVTFVQETLCSAREGVDSFHSRIYASALAIAAKLNIEEAMPRTTVRQQHRGNVPSTSPSQYFQRQLTIPALDYLIADIAERFSPRLTTALSQTIGLLPSSVAASSNVLSSANFQDLVSLYEDEMT